MTTIESRLERLEDIEASGQLCLAYGRHLDNREWPELAALFAAQGELILEPLGRASGRDAIVAMMARLGTTRGSVFHIIGRPVIGFDGDGATSDVAWTMIARGPEDRPVLGMQGRHRDTLIRDDSGWRFLRREGIIELPRVLPTAPAH